MSANADLGTNLTGLKNELGLCQVPKSTEFSSFNVILQEVLAGAAEFNYATTRGGRGPVSYPLDKVINIALEESDPIQIVNKTVWIWFGPSPGLNLNEPCINHTAPGVTNPLVPLIQTNIFNYVTSEY
jgi:hypothetical protein